MLKYIKKLSTKNTQSIVLKWVLSYISILLLPILFCTFYYYHSAHLLMERAATNQHLLLNNLGEEISATLNDSIHLNNNLRFNKEVSNLVNTSSDTLINQMFDVYKLNNNLKMLQVSNAKIQQIDIYFKNSNYIVSSSSTYKMDLLPYLKGKKTLLQQKDWKKIDSNLQNSNLYISSFNSSSNLYIAQTLLNDAHNHPSAILVIRIKKDTLYQSILQKVLKNYQSSYILVNSKNEFIDLAKQETYSKKSIHYFLTQYKEQNPKPQIIKYNSHAFRIDSTVLAFPNTKLLSIVPNDQYASDMIELHKIIFISLISCIFFGMLIIFNFSRKNYMPIKQILNFMKTSGNMGNIDSNQNEYNLIMNMLKQRQTEIEYQSLILKNNYFEKILTGEIKYSNIPSGIKSKFHLNLEDSSICVITISDLNDVKPLTFHQNDTLMTDSQSLKYFIIENILNELLSNNFPDKYFYIHQQTTVLILGIPDSIEDPIHLIFNSMQLLFETLDQYKMELYGSYSAIHNSNEIAEAFIESQSALTYTKRLEKERFYWFCNIPNQTVINEISLNNNDFIINLVVSGNQNAISQYFENIRKEIQSHKLSLLDINACFYFYYHVTAQLKLYCQSTYEFIPDSLNFIDNLFFSNTLSIALFKISTAYINASIEIENHAKQVHSESLEVKIKHFIDNNYFDMNMNQNTIAEHFDITPAYLSKKFKLYFRKSIIDYLYEVRIMKSLQLMEKSSLKISEIAQMTGFTDSNAFIRIFKKNMGITPGKYASQKHGKESFS